jgi:hypothetical protein
LAAVLRKLSTPEKIQRFLDDLPYNNEKSEETCRSPRLVLEYKTAHCFEGALLGAAALRVNGSPSLILDLASVRDDDHVIAIYRSNGDWGALFRSNSGSRRWYAPEKPPDIKTFTCAEAAMGQPSSVENTMIILIAIAMCNGLIIVPRMTFRASAE